MNKPPSNPTPKAAGSGAYNRMTPIDSATWAHLLATFREKPADVGFAATECHVEVRIAQKAWQRGWPGSYPPIREALLDEQTQGRALAEREGAERAKDIRIQAAVEETTRLREAQAGAIMQQISAHALAPEACCVIARTRKEVDALKHSLESSTFKYF